LNKECCFNQSLAKSMQINASQMPEKAWILMTVCQTQAADSGLK